MNKARRKTIADYLDRITKAITLLDGLSDELEELQTEEQDAFDNLSEGLQGSERGQQMELAASQLVEAWRRGWRACACSRMQSVNSKRRESEMQVTISQSAHISASGDFAGFNRHGDVCVRDGDRIYCGALVSPIDADGVYLRHVLTWGHVRDAREGSIM